MTTTTHGPGTTHGATHLLRPLLIVLAITLAVVAVAAAVLSLGGTEGAPLLPMLPGSESACVVGAPC